MTPSLSVVVVTRDDYRTLRPIIASLRLQRGAKDMELVVVGPRGAVRVPPADMVGFHSVRVVEVGSVTNRGQAAAAGVLAATAPVIALTENHCFPEPEWAERTLASHAEGWAGVGPAVGNANPESELSRAMHAFGYGQFPLLADSREVEELPLHNCSYRADVLPRELDRLGMLLSDERRLQLALRQGGHVFRFEPRAVKWHVNEATWRLFVGLSYNSGRRYGGTRAAQWPLWRRAVYTAATPLLSLLIARSTWSKHTQAEAGSDLHLAIVIWLGAVAHAVGEAVSYSRGARSTFPFVDDDEFLIRERLGGRAVTRPTVASLLSLLDVADAERGP